MADKKISQLTAADVADLGALNSFFEVSVNTLVTPTSRKIGLGKIATWLATIGLAASNVLAQGITVTQGTITNPAAGYAQSVTWNDAADTFIAQTLDVTDTASAAGSLLARWRVGGVDKFVVSKAGAITAGAASFTTGAFSGAVTGNGGVITSTNVANPYFKVQSSSGTTDSWRWLVLGATQNISLVNDTSGYGTIIDISRTGAITLGTALGGAGAVTIPNNLTVGSSAFVVTAATGATTIAGPTQVKDALYLGIANSTQGIAQFYYQSNAASRSWRLLNDSTAFGDFAIRQSTTQSGSTFADVMYFAANKDATLSGALAITGALTGVTTLAASATITAGLYGYTHNVGIIESGTNATATMYVNYVGYAGGTTQYRDFIVYDGKQQPKLSLVGSTGVVTITSLAGVGTRTVVVDANGVLSAP